MRAPTSQRPGASPDQPLSAVGALASQPSSSPICPSAVAASRRLQTTPLRVLSNSPVRKAKPSPASRRSAGGKAERWVSSATSADQASSPSSSLRTGGLARCAACRASHAPSSPPACSAMPASGRRPTETSTRSTSRWSGPVDGAPAHAPSAVRPAASRAWRSSGTQPTSTSTTSSAPRLAARCSAVPPVTGSRTFGSTPSSSSVYAASARPSRAARSSTGACAARSRPATCGRSPARLRAAWRSPANTAPRSSSTPVASSASTRLTSAGQLGSPSSRAIASWASASRGSRSARSRASAWASPARAARSSALASRRARSRSILRSIDDHPSSARGPHRRAEVDRSAPDEPAEVGPRPCPRTGCALVRGPSLPAPDGQRITGW